MAAARAAGAERPPREAGAPGIGFGVRVQIEVANTSPGRYEVPLAAGASIPDETTDKVSTMSERTELQLAMYTTPRLDVVDMVEGDPGRVLDVGCSDGSLGVALKERAVDPAREVCGIEQDPGFAERAADRLDQVLTGDALEHVAALADAGERFDTVICADSLEHMVEPGQVMLKVRELVKVGGQCVVSLPNVRFYTTFTNLLFRGRWPLVDRGVHDRTHLRWFTDKNAREMFSSAGFNVEDVFTHYRITDLPDPNRNAHAARYARGPLKPFMAYQYVYRLRLAR